MLRVILFTILIALLWSASAIIIGYEIPQGALLPGVVTGWTCTYSSISRKSICAIILTIVGVILTHFLLFSFYMQHPLDGIFSPLNLTLFFQINRYVSNFWTIWDALWLLLAIGLSVFIVRWRNA